NDMGEFGAIPPANQTPGLRPEHGSSYSASSIPREILKTCPSGCRTCISRTFQGMSVGGQVISKPCSRQRRCTASTSSTHIDIHTPLSAESSPSGPNVILRELLPRPPWAFWQRKISQSPEQTPPNVGGLPQSHPFFHPSFSNQAKLCWIFETLRIGV